MHAVNSKQLRQIRELSKALITYLGTDAKCGRNYNLRSDVYIKFMKQNGNIAKKLQLQTAQMYQGN